MEQVRYGIIGVGNMGSGYVNDYLNGKIIGGKITAIADNNPAKLSAWDERLDSGVARFSDAEELMASGLVDAVVIATPHYYHPPMAIRGFRHNLHVVIEKPAGVYTKQVREMNEAAEKSGKRFCIMFQNRLNPVHRKMKELMDQGAVGELKRTTLIITDWYRPQAYYDSGSWRATWEGEGGGVLLNQCPHNLDLWQWIVGMTPSRIRAFCHAGKWHNIEVEDDVSAYVEYPNGATGTFVTSTSDWPGTNLFEILGDKGKLTLSGGKLTYLKNSVSEREFNEKNTVAFAAPSCEAVEVAIDGQFTGHIGMMNDFFQSILQDTPLFIPGEEGIKSLSISNAMYLSSWLNETVELPLDEECFLKELDKRRAVSAYKQDDAAQDRITDLSGSFMK